MKRRAEIFEMSLDGNDELTFDPLVPLTWPLIWSYGIGGWGNRETHWDWKVARKRPAALTDAHRIELADRAAWPIHRESQTVADGRSLSAPAARQKIIEALRLQRLLLEEWQRSPRLPYSTFSSNASVNEWGSYDPVTNRAVYDGSYPANVDVWQAREMES